MNVTNRRPHPRILVLDADQVPALTIARSLARRRYLVDVASAYASPIAAFSNTVCGKFRYPDPLLAEEAFVRWLADHQALQAYDLVIPVTERSLVPLSKHRDRLHGVRIAMAETASLDQVLDKATTFALAERLGVPTPHSAYVSDMSQLPAAAAALSFPVVLKPSHSVTAAGAGYSKLNVSYAGNQQELESKCREQLRYSPLILQSYFPGRGVGIELIATAGRILYSFQHLRLHEVPLTGGGSSFRMSTDVNPELLEASEKLIQAINWTGVAMVEFKWNPDSGAFCLMEINGRFWGSLPLATAAGADFPAMLAELLLTGEMGTYPDYRRGVYSRSLGKDITWHEMVLRTRSDVVTRVPGIGSVLSDIAKTFLPAHHFDTQSLRDPLPGLVELQRTAASYLRRFFELADEMRFTLRQRMYWRNGTVRERLRAADTVLFICYGNINRSALAEALMASMPGIDCDKQLMSAGFHPEEQRPADERMVRVAANHGCDLSRSRSAQVSNETLRGSDIIFVMEKTHYDRLAAMDAGSAGRVFLLGAHDGGPVNIADPYNRPAESYQLCFTQVQRAVSLLVADLQAGAGNGGTRQ